MSSHLRLRARHVSVLGALFMAGLAFAQTAADSFIIVGARIEPRVGEVLTNGYVLVEGGVIRAMGSGSPPTTSARRIDGSGLWVFPGFIDGFVTRGLKLPEWKTTPGVDTTTTAPPTMLAVNNKGARPDLKASDILDQKSVAEDMNKAGFTVLHMVPGAGMFRGQGAVIAAADGKKEQVLIKDGTVQGSSFLSGGAPGSYPGSLFAVVAQMRQILSDAQREAHPAAEGKNPLAKALTPVLSKEMPVLFQADTAKEIYRALNFRDEFGFNVIFAQGREASKHASTLAQQNVPVIATLSLPVKPTQGDSITNVIPEPILQERIKDWEDRMRNVADLEKAGVKLALTLTGTNSSDFLSNVRELLANGLTRDGALKALTQNPAEILGIEGQYGSLAVGRPASLTILTGDLGSPSAKVHAVVVQGRWVAQTESK